MDPKILNGDDPELDLELDDGIEENDDQEQSDPDGGEDAEGDERVEGQRQDAHDEENEGQARRVAARPNRAATRLQTLRNENRQLAEVQARQQREIEELRSARQSQTQTVDPAIEAQRLALMTPDERIEYRFQQSEERNARTQRALQMQIAEGNDRAAFMASIANDPVGKKFSDKVEQLFQEQLRRGNFVPREALLNHEIGAAARRRAQQAAPKQRQQAQRRVQQQTTRAGNGRGDVAANRRGGQSIEDRLADVII